MVTNQPRVSIGFPVYNGEKFIRQALDSLLGQTFTDFELIISDNASTDNTEVICREYAQKDKRISYYRQEKNLGAGPNYNQVFELSRGKYFKWAAHDDLCAPEYLAKCVAILDRDPSVVWCHSQTIFIDDDGLTIPFDTSKDGFVDKYGNLFRKHDRDRDLDSAEPYVRYREILSATRWCFEIFGLIRTDALKQILQVDRYQRTEIMGPYYGSDKVLLAELSLIGRYIEISEPLFFRRCHSNQSSAIGSTQKERDSWIVLKNTAKTVATEKDTPVTTKANKPLQLPARIICLGGYLRPIIRTPLSWRDRFLCLIELIRWLFKLDNWQRFIYEIFREKFNIFLPGQPL
jgi:glycosyltransferase involved in cell wall biosynthesis